MKLVYQHSILLHLTMCKVWAGEQVQDYSVEEEQTLWATLP